MNLARDADATVNELKKQAYHDTIERERSAICRRGAKKVVTRNVHHHRVEHELYLNDIKNKNTYSNVQANLQQEEKLAIELRKQQRDEITDIKTRQQLRENSLELRELESKLRAAYVTKELAAQLAEKEYLKLKQKMEEKESSDILNNAIRSHTVALQVEAEEDLKRRMEYRKDLQDQIIIKYKEKQNKYEEFLREKKLLDEIIQRIHDEDQREMEDKMCKMKKTNAEIAAFKETQKIWREKERHELETENRRIEEFLKNREIQEREKEMQKAEQREAKEKSMEEMAKKMYIEQLQKKEREEILQDLLYEEIKEKEEQRIKEEFQKQIRQRIEMQNTLARQLQEREERIKQDELADARYKEQMLAKIMEDDKIEQMTVDKRRRKMIQLRRDVEEHMKERRARRAEELRTLLHLQEQEKAREDNRQKIIEDERLRLLKEHASNLIGYLPPGVLREDDLPHLGSEILKHYSTK